MGLTRALLWACKGLPAGGRQRLLVLYVQERELAGVDGEEAAEDEAQYSGAAGRGRPGGLKGFGGGLRGGPR